MFEERVKAAHALLDSALETYNATKVYALFSGGHDSLCATHVASSHPNFKAVLHINTGIGIEDTRRFVRETCQQHGWPLIEIFAAELGQHYEELVTLRGFPGPPLHYMMYSRLKDKCIDNFTKNNKDFRTERLILAGGSRSQESSRRMRHVEPIQQEKRRKCRIWTNPIHDWSKLDCNEYITWAGLRRNEVVDLLHMSGECLCGAFAKEGELSEIELWYPKTAAHIRAIEEKVKAKGFHWGWEGRPAAREKKSRLDASGKVVRKDSEPHPEVAPHLCTSCMKKEH